MSGEMNAGDRAMVEALASAGFDQHMMYETDSSQRCMKQDILVADLKSALLSRLAALCAERDALAKRVKELEPWRDAVIDAAVVDWTYRKEHETDPKLAVNDLICYALDVERSELAARVKELETPDSLMPPHSECAYLADDLVALYDDMQVPLGECRRVLAFKTLPDRWLAHVVVTRDDDGDPDDTELRLFATKADADAVLARPTLRQEGV